MAADDAKTEKVARRTSGIGPTGRTIAANVARIRRARELTTAGLANRLEAAGHPILATGITKIEQGERRVSAEDLVALAVVLNVNPSALLLPDSTEGAVEVTGAGPVHAEDAWEWADGRRPLLDADDESVALAFQLHARPAGRRSLSAT